VTVDFPPWLYDLAIISLVAGFICAIVIVIDEVRRPPKMWIMNLGREGDALIDRWIFAGRLREIKTVWRAGYKVVSDGVHARSSGVQARYRDVLHGFLN
jgi:hypothetical protein